MRATLRPCTAAARGAAAAPRIARPMKARRLVTPSSGRPSRLRRAARDGRDLVGEVHLAVVLRLVADLRLRAGQAPEAVRVAADPVDDQERDAVVVLDVLGLDHADGLLDLVAPREVRAERPVHHLDVARLHVLDVVVARTPDTP